MRVIYENSNCDFVNFNFVGSWGKEIIDSTGCLGSPSQYVWCIEDLISSFNCLFSLFKICNWFWIRQGLRADCWKVKDVPYQRDFVDELNPRVLCNRFKIIWSCQIDVIPIKGTINNENNGFKDWEWGFLVPLDGNIDNCWCQWNTCQNNSPELPVLKMLPF